MIPDVIFAKTSHQGIPARFEAGTPDIAGVVGLGAAIDYLESVGLPGNAAYEHGLLDYATAALEPINDSRQKLLWNAPIPKLHSPFSCSDPAQPRH
jgi:cysteine desulfurase/selenocysteine lyase